MSEHPKPTCKVICGRETYEGKQALRSYISGIAAETTGSQRICMHLLNMPPKGRAKAHLHENHETAIYVISGQAGMWYGEHETAIYVISGQGMASGWRSMNPSTVATLFTSPPASLTFPTIPARLKPVLL